MFKIIVETTTENRPARYAVRETRAEADAFVVEHGGDIVETDAPVADLLKTEGGWIVSPQSTPATAADVIAERDRRINEGTTINVPGIGDIPVSGSPVVQADLTSLAQAAQIAIAAGDPEAMFPFRDRAGATHALTPEQVVSLFMSGVDWLASVRAAAWALIDADPVPADFTDDKHWP